MKLCNNAIILIFVIGLFGCQSAKKLYQQGDYYQAVIKSTKKLRNNPDHKKTKEALAYAYPLAVEQLTAHIENLKVANPRFKFTKSIDSYQKLNNMHSQIKKSPGARKVIPNPENFVAAMRDAKLGAAEEQYREGMLALNQNTREDAKRAYAYFQMSNSFSKDYKDVKSRIDEAYSNAILHVLVHLEPIQSQRYQLSGNFFYDQVVKVFREIEYNEFIRFHTPAEARKINLDRPHQLLTVNFVDFRVGDVYSKERVEKVERDSVVVGSVKRRDGSEQKVYNTVSAKLTINRMEVVSGGRLRIQIQDEYSSATLKKEDLIGEHVWYNEWGSFNGDERALSDSQIVMCERRMVPPPPAQDLFVEFTKPIYSQVRSHLTRFYRDY